jgi:hypothetical protein
MRATSNAATAGSDFSGAKVAAITSSCAVSCFATPSLVEESMLRLIYTPCSRAQCTKKPLMVM